MLYSEYKHSDDSYRMSHIFTTCARVTNRIVLIVQRPNVLTFVITTELNLIVAMCEAVGSSNCLVKKYDSDGFSS